MVSVNVFGALCWQSRIRHISSHVDDLNLELTTNNDRIDSRFAAFCTYILIKQSINSRSQGVRI